MRDFLQSYMLSQDIGLANSQTNRLYLQPSILHLVGIDIEVPFGLKSAQDEFQKRIDQNLEGQEGMVFIADDI